MRNYRNVVVVVAKGKQENNRNVLGVQVELKQQKCGCGGGKTIEVWVVVYSFTIHEAVLKKKKSVGSTQGR